MSAIVVTNRKEVPVPVPSELKLVFNLIRNSEAKDIALNCLREIFDYLILLQKLPKPGVHIKEIVDRQVYQSLIKLQQFEQASGVSAALIALGAFYSNESRRSFLKLNHQNTLL